MVLLHNQVKTRDKTGQAALTVAERKAVAGRKKIKLAKAAEKKRKVSGWLPAVVR
jgi:hypothetical protein